MSESNKTSDFKTGAVRSADANHLDFTSLPLVGLIGVARTASEGGTKYGRYNYMQGMPVHDTLNHSIRHICMYILGDRSEPHLEHAAWGLLASIQQETLDPSVSAPHMLGPGATITPEVQGYLDANADRLADSRKAGEFANIGNWSIRDLPEIKTILSQREREIGTLWDDPEHEDEDESDDDGSLEGISGLADRICSPVVRYDDHGERFRVEHPAGREYPSRPWNEVVNGATKESLKERCQANDDGECHKCGDGPMMCDKRVDQNIAEHRFRVPDKGRPSIGRIVRGRIECNNFSVKPGEREFEEVLIVNRPEMMYALMSKALCNKRVLVVEQKDWDAGQPYEIDSAWGYASSSAKSSKITGEVTRTENIDPLTLLPEPNPVCDEAYVDFLTFQDNVRVYFKKS